MALQSKFWHHYLWEIVYQTGCTIADVKITFEELAEADAEEIRELLSEN